MARELNATDQSRGEETGDHGATSDTARRSVVDGAKDDLDDLFPVDGDGVVTIEVTHPFDKVVDRSVRVLGQCAPIFQRQGELVTLVGEDSGVKLRPLRNVEARYRLSSKARWTKDGKPTHPPDHVAKCIVARTAWEQVRSLRAVTTFPALDPTGMMPTEPGYHAATKTYFASDVALSIKEQPTQQDAVDAVKTIEDVISDFPFAGDEHRAAWLAGLLTPLARHAHDGNAPLIVVQANSPRVGKTTLVKLISEIVIGSTCPVVTMTKNEDETRKRVLSFLRFGRSMVLVDNVVGVFGGQNVNALLTSRSFEDRILGTNKVVEATNDTSWFVTGNNVALSPDTAERCINVRLQTEDAKPHLRDDFKYPDLYETVRERRGQLLSAALTILKAYMIAGKPDQHLPAWGGFEAWSRLVRGALVFAGTADPAASRVELEEQSDVETDANAELIAGLADFQGRAELRSPLRTQDILERFRRTPDLSPSFRLALHAIAGAPGSYPTPHTLSRHFRDAKMRNFGGLVLRMTPDPKHGHRWFVDSASVAVRSTGEAA
jgi:hypothetical protein